MPLVIQLTALQVKVWHGMARHGLYSSSRILCKRCLHEEMSQDSSQQRKRLYGSSSLFGHLSRNLRVSAVRLHCINVTAFVKLTYNGRPSTKGTSVQINRTDTQLTEISVISSQKQALVSHFENLPKALPKFVLTELWKELQVKPTSRQLSLSLSLCKRTGPRTWRWQQSTETFLMLPCCRIFPNVISVPRLILSWFQMMYSLSCFHT